MSRLQGFSLHIAKIRQRATNYSRQPGPKTPVKWAFLLKNSPKTRKTLAWLPVFPKIRGLEATKTLLKIEFGRGSTVHFRMLLNCFACLHQSIFAFLTTHNRDGNGLEKLTAKIVANERSIIQLIFCVQRL
jgi:hypothetical protein